MDNDDFLQTWELLREGLRKLRGQNRFRGNEEHLIHKREIRLYKEPRGGRLQSKLFVLSITPKQSDLTAKRLPSGETIAAADFGGDWEAWLGAIVAELRGADYLRSNSGQANYRKSFMEQK